MNANTPDGPTGLHQIDLDHIEAYPYTDPSAVVGKRIARDCGGAGESASELKACKAARLDASWQPPGTTAGASAWSSTLVDANEVERYASLTELTAGADAVVRGRVTAVVPGRVFGDPDGEALHYAAATVRVDDLLAGALPRAHARELTLEIPLFDGPQSIGQLQSSLPGTESVFFLRNKGVSAAMAGLPADLQAAESVYYRLAIFRGVVVNEGGRAATLAGEEDDFLAALDALPFEELVRRIRAPG